MCYSLKQFNLFLILITCVFVAFLSGVATTHAQSLSFTQNSTLVSTPSFPKPYTLVVVELNDYSVQNLGSTIYWYVNGVEQTNERNNRSISITTGGVGTVTEVRAVSKSAQGFEQSYSKKITPSVVDVIVESDTYVPPFYIGRSLPNSGAHIRAVAVVHDGKNTDKSSYTYEWSGGSGGQFNWPVKGATSIEYTLPLFDAVTLSVVVHDAVGNAVGKGSVLLMYAQPELYFYASSPLSGYASRAYSKATQFIAEETTVIAEPYYTVTRPSNATFNWKINGEDVSDTNNVITVSRPDSSGTSVLSATMSSVQRPLEHLMKSLELTF